LKDITFALEDGSFLAIVGPSGSGKTTLLGLLAGLDLPASGRVWLDGADLTVMTEDERARIRSAKIGFVFQSFQLIPTLTARENVQVPLELRGEPSGARADELLDQVGLGERLDHYPAQLSGGEQQRVALARAFSIRPRILFADEPTGNLDARTGGTIIDLILELNEAEGTTLVLVTHDPDIASRARRTILLSDGRIAEHGRLMSRFVRRMAWRETRGSRRRLLLLTGAVAVGVAALVAVNSFAANLRESVTQQAQTLLGADLSISSRQPFTPRVTALLDTLVVSDPADGRAPGRKATVVGFAAMGYVNRTEGVRLVQVAAVWWTRACSPHSTPGSETPSLSGRAGSSSRPAC
jgi:putative ABC transport system ATP-binding protein